ncbi:hypothetical protein NBRC110019_09420 [Neptunitalea chrysea]|uniref:Lipoprotein n=1 Tax=Neptunitalea chrysea TaxID=1647581 RepID=A0A9W6B3J0_9FLAO|nr:DUF6146 family protein [Neptunitalea chrysea]GLB51903.1 hypothetical protein NBRC110019_09420 [Neptunitalea chrysea]
MVLKRFTYHILGIALLLFIIFVSCKPQTPTVSDTETEIFNSKESDTITIANDSLEYEVIIIEPGFYAWLQSMARPRGFYSQTFLENRNILFVNEWNRRVTMPQRYNPNLYELQINYTPNIDYGYEVNYQMYNYFIYFQRKYNQRLTGLIPRI